MENKPLVFFAAFMIVALIIIAGYLIMSNPAKAFQNTVSSDQAIGEQQAMLLYVHNCASCHGTSGNGLNGNPSLINNGLSEEQIRSIIRNGRGKMPALPRLTDEQVEKIARFVKRF